MRKISDSSRGTRPLSRMATRCLSFLQSLEARGSGARGLGSAMRLHAIPEPRTPNPEKRCGPRAPDPEPRKTMPKIRVYLTFPTELIQVPIIYHLAKDFDIVTNIRRADVTPTYGWVALELEGAEEN